MSDFLAAKKYTSNIINQVQQKAWICFFFILIFFSSIMISRGYQNTLFALYATVIVALFSLDIKKGIVAYVIASYFLPFLSKIIYASQREIHIRDFLSSLPDWLLLVMFAIFLAGKFVKKETITCHILDRFILMYIIINCLFIFKGGNIPVGIYGARVVIFPLFMYFMARIFFRSVNDLKLFLSIIMICSIADVCYALYQYYFGFPYFDLIKFIDYPEMRRMVFWDSRSGLSGFHKLLSFSGGSYSLYYPLAFFAIILINIGDAFKDRLFYYLRFVFLAAVFFLLSLGIERTPIAMLIVGVVASRFDPTSARVFLTSLAKGVVILILAFIVLTLSRPFLLATDSYKLYRIAELSRPFEAETIHCRMDVEWRDAFDYMKSTRFLGTGLGRASGVSERIQKGAFVVAPHNMFFKIIVETGIIGFVAFCAAFVAIFRTMAMNYRNTESILFRRFIKGLFGGTIAIFAAGIANLSFEHHLGIFFWFLIGILPLIGELSEKGNDKDVHEKT